MKTVSELKRSLKVGMKVKLVESLYYGKPVTHLSRLVGVDRVVTIVQSNCFALLTETRPGVFKDSYMDFPKASNFIGTEKGFIIKRKDILEGTSLEYEIV